MFYVVCVFVLLIFIYTISLVSLLTIVLLVTGFDVAFLSK